MEMRPCGWDGSGTGPYTEKYVRSLFGRRKYMTALRALDLDIPDEDKLWFVLRPEVIDDVTLRLLSCDFAERALKRERRAGQEPDERSWNAIRVSRRYARGKATDEELAAARAAARAAAWDAACAAAWDAAWAAAWDAARAAAWDAACTAAWDAACTAACAAARAAAWDAARAAAWDAACAAAWDAADATVYATTWDVDKATERKWQVKRVRKYLEAA
jgi:hypothetical protein